MTTRSCRSLVLLLAFVVLFPSTAAPPTSRFTVAGADGRFELAYAPDAKIAGVTAAESQQIHAAVRQVAEVFRASPAVNSPPAPLCTRITTYLPPGIELGLEPAPNVSVQVPIEFRNGRCSNITCCGVDVAINSPAPLRKGQEVEGPGAVRVEDEKGPMYAFHRLEPLASDGAYARYRRMVVLSKRTEPIFLPVTREEYLRALEAAWAREALKESAGAQRSVDDLRTQQPQLREQLAREKDPAVRKLLEDSIRMIDGNLQSFATVAAAAGQTQRQELEKVRAELAWLAPAERAAQACRPATGGWIPSGGGPCEPRRLVWRDNPAFFDRSLGKGAVQLLVISYPPKSVEESPESFALRERIFATADLAALAAVPR
jgi:hypothetical protein